MYDLSKMSSNSEAFYDRSQIGNSIENNDSSQHNWKTPMHFGLTADIPQSLNRTQNCQIHASHLK